MAAPNNATTTMVLCAKECNKKQPKPQAQFWHYENQPGRYYKTCKRCYTPAWVKKARDKVAREQRRRLRRRQEEEQGQRREEEQRRRRRQAVPR
jgi:hypothetical protein